MICLLRYYYKLKDCSSLNIGWHLDNSISLYGFEQLRQVEIGCVIIDQLTGNCYELLEVSETLPLSLEAAVQSTSCHVYKTCEACLAVIPCLGCTDLDSCNYDPCATFTDANAQYAGSCYTDISITMSIEDCPGEITLCENINC